jgi:hypothetical protein
MAEVPYLRIDLTRSPRVNNPPLTPKPNRRQTSLNPAQNQHSPSKMT